MTPSVQALARRNHSTLLQALAEITQERAAELAEVDASKLSKMKASTGEDSRSDLERICAVLAACNLQVVPRTFRAVDPDKLRALAVLARDSISDAAGDSGWWQL